jgi:hypothetical protein
MLLLVIGATVAYAVGANDTQLNAVTLSPAGGGYIWDNNTGASGDSGEPKNLWFKWTAPSNGTVGFDTSGTDRINTRLVLFQGGTRIDHNPDYTENGGAVHEWSLLPARTVSAGTTYYVSVGSEDSREGLFRLNWSFTADTTPTPTPEETPPPQGTGSVSGRVT